MDGKIAAIISCLFLSCLCVSEAAWTTADITPKNYNPSRAPQINETEPLEVRLYLKVLAILHISEAEQSFTVDMVYRLSWTDYRLKLPSYHIHLYPIVLDMSWKKSIWVPDVYIRNALKVTTLDGTIAPVTHLEVSANNNVDLIARLTVKMICDMQLFAYPHDMQHCYLDSKSLSYNKNQVVLVWENFTVDESIYFPKFRIDEYYALDECEKEPERRSCIRGVLALSRKVSFYVTRFYAPTLLITSATFISYWMSAGEVAPRVVINMTPFLTLVTLHNALNNEINVSYVVALHIWMFACMFYTFMGLVVLFFAMQIHAAEMKRQTEAEKKRLREENNNMFRKFSRAVSDAGANKLQEEEPEERMARRKSSFMGTRIETPAWMEKAPASFRAWWTRVKLWMKKQWKKIERLGSKDGVYLNPADRIARVVAPTTFATFIILYVVFFYYYYEEHVTGSGW